MAKKKQKAKSPQKSPPVHQPEKAIVYVVGDSPMVEEYITLCSSHGYAVLYDLDDKGQTSPNIDSRLVRKTAKIPGNVSFALELTNIDLEKKRKNLEALDKALPVITAIASSSITVSATEQSSWIDKKSRLVGICSLPTLSNSSLIEVAPTVFSPAETIQVAQRFFKSVGKEIELVEDRVGMVFPRIICQIINEAAFALQEEIASPQDIDMAMRVGANFPLGPIEWADRLGMQHVYAVLSALHRDLGEERYRISPLLRQMALSGTWWKRM
ncbi:MAG: 3-hydroxyacyl-CoA dehydrogenase family protein [Ignavibacteriales bacterium]|nr:3-hydroxyacyl-CoA dehydrogenase family protein [Ignavibacteriales bacterium]